MCYVVEPEVVLVNYLLLHPKAKLNPKNLGKLQKKIYGKVQGSLYVDVTDNSVCGAVRRLNYLFEWDEKDKNHVVRAKNSNRYYDQKYVDAINNGVPRNILKSVVEACE